MTNDDSVPVSKETKQRLEKRKQKIDESQSGVPDLTMDQYIQSLMDTEKAVQEGYYNTGVPVSELPDDYDVLAQDYKMLRRGYLKRCERHENLVSELRELVERYRNRADMVEEHGLDNKNETLNQRNEWNIEVWRSVSNEIEARLIEEYNNE